MPPKKNKSEKDMSPQVNISYEGHKYNFKITLDTTIGELKNMLLYVLLMEEEKIADNNYNVSFTFSGKKYDKDDETVSSIIGENYGAVFKSTLKPIVSVVKKPRCPKGTQRNKKTGECERKGTRKSKGSVSKSLSRSLMAVPSPVVPSPPRSLTPSLSKDFSGKDLSGKDFSGKDLSSEDFTGANLSGAIFKGTNLTAAILEGANLKGANLEKAILRDAFLNDADLTSAKLKGADFSFAQLDCAKLMTNLEGVNFSFTRLNTQNFENKKLKGALFRGADLRGVDFRNADLRTAIFEDADLRGATLIGAKMKGAKMDGANLEGADM
jgi:hypothetical protein